MFLPDISSKNSYVYTFEEVVRLIARAVGSRARIVHLSPAVAMGVLGLLGRLIRDVILTRDELKGLMADPLVSADQPTGKSRFSDWLPRYATNLGVRYANELERNYR